MVRSRVVLLALLVAAIAGAAPVVGALAKTPWSGENPGQAADHARMPEAALEHNQALADHPPAGERGHGDHGDDNETGDDDDGAGDHNGTGDDEDEDGADEHNETGHDDSDDDAEDNETDSGTQEPSGASGHAAMVAQWYLGNHSHNGSAGSGTWNFSNGTLTVTAGNFSWHGINCSWENFTWSKGQNLSDVINITCDFWGIYTVTVANGEVTVTWSNGTWNHTWGAPMAPEEAQAMALMAYVQHEASASTDLGFPSASPVTIKTPF